MESYFGNILAIESAEIEMKKIVRAVKFYEDLETLNIREAENRAFMEDGGSFETLCAFYEDAETEEMVKKKKSIRKRAWESVLNLCRKIKKFFETKEEEQIDPNQEVVVDATNRKIRKNLIDFFKKWKNSLSHPCKNPKAFIKAIVPLAVLIGGIMAIKAKGKKISKKKKTTKSETAAPISKKTQSVQPTSLPPKNNTVKEKVKAEEGEVVVKAGELLKDKKELESEVLEPLTKATEELVDVDAQLRDKFAKEYAKELDELNKSIEQVSKTVSILKEQRANLESELESLKEQSSKSTDEIDKAYDDVRLAKKKLHGDFSEKNKMYKESPEKLDHRTRDLFQRVEKLEKYTDKKEEEHKKLSDELFKLYISPTKDRKKIAIIEEKIKRMDLRIIKAMDLSSEIKKYKIRPSKELEERVKKLEKQRDELIKKHENLNDEIYKKSLQLKRLEYEQDKKIDEMESLKNRAGLVGELKEKGLDEVIRNGRKR